LLTGLADLRATTNQTTGQPLGGAHKHSPAGQLDEVPPIDRTIDDLMIFGDDALVHTLLLALMVAEQYINVKN
jgi:hypothetical protein